MFSKKLMVVNTIVRIQFWNEINLKNSTFNLPSTKWYKLEAGVSISQQ